jgi:hypothetical protein
MLNSKGHLIMGAGVAKQFADKWPGLPSLFGDRVRAFGNQVNTVTGTNHPTIVAFPTKHDWKDKSDINLIVKSTMELMNLIDEREWLNVYLCRPGVGLGGLNWLTEVKPVIEPILDNRVIVTYL